jgi:hypothetical protein
MDIVWKETPYLAYTGLLFETETFVDWSHFLTLANHPLTLFRIVVVMHMKSFWSILERL